MDTELISKHCRLPVSRHLNKSPYKHHLTPGTTRQDISVAPHEKKYTFYRISSGKQLKQKTTKTKRKSTITNSEKGQVENLISILCYLKFQCSTKYYKIFKEAVRYGPCAGRNKSIEALRALEDLWNKDVKSAIKNMFKKKWKEPCLRISWCSVAKSGLTLETLWTVAHQVLPWSMGFPKQEYWSGLPFPFPRDLPKPGMEPGSPALTGRCFTNWVNRN